jgi:hypothetical protein
MDEKQSETGKGHDHMDRLQRSLDTDAILTLIVWELIDADEREQRVVDELSEPYAAGHEQYANHIR